MKTARLAAFILLIGAFGASAFVQNLNTSGARRHWVLLTYDGTINTNVVNPTTQAIRIFFASDGYSTTNTAAELNAARSAFAQWQAVPGTYLKFEDAGLISPPVDVNTSDNTNVFYWAKSSTIVNGGLSSISGALGVTFSKSSSSDNRVLQADIVFNGVQYQWFTDFFDTNSTTTYVEGVALHEIGHFIGLNHSPVGGATMLFHGLGGVNAGVGLSSDDIAAARFIYPTNLSSYGAIKGTITTNGQPVYGAGVYAENSVSNLVAGTVSETNGVYLLPALPPDVYRIRVAPLDAFAATSSLVRGADISSAYTNANSTFLPTNTATTTVTAGVTNTVDVAVIPVAPTFRITNIREPTTSSGSFNWSSSPVTMNAGQSNYFIGVASADLPTNSATLAITGNGLTLGSPTFNANLGGLGLNFITVPISVSSNATPGLRTFIVQQGTNIAYANGFLDILPTNYDYNFDGLDDSFQRTNFALFTSASDAPTADPDGDGMNNLGEYISGTSPTNAASVFKMTSLVRTNTGTTIGWQSVVGKHYQVFSRSNFSTDTWRSNGTFITAAGTNTTRFDAGSTNGLRAYHVQVFQ